MEPIGKVLGSLHRGKVTPAPKMPELDKLEELRRSLNVSSLEHTFDNFVHVPGAEKAFKLFKELASGSDWKLLLCYGGTGNGKTYLCEALVIELYRRGIFLRLLTMNDITDALKRSMSKGSIPPYDVKLSNYCRTPRLIMDDFGIGEGTSDFSPRILEQIINYRQKENLLTVVTTNLNVKSLPERVVSRFKDTDYARMVLNEAADFRPEKRKREKEKCH